MIVCFQDVFSGVKLWRILFIIGLFAIVAVKGDQSRIDCPLCKWVADDVKNRLNATAIDAVVDDVCRIIPRFKKQCEEIVNQGVEALICVIRSMSSLEICQKLGYCPRIST